MNLETELSPDLWLAVRRSYESQLWSNSLLDAIHFLSEAIRSRTGLESDGTALVGQALGGKAPKLRLNRMETESEKNVQEGVEQLLRGLYRAVRNPRSHEKVEDSRVDAEALIIFVNYLLRVLGQAKDSFSVEECASRVLDENFVPSPRYVDLLIAEIPQRKRLAVALAVFHRKSELKGRNQTTFFKLLVKALSDNEQVELWEAVSSELRTNKDVLELRSLLQLLDPEDWRHIDEAARLRTENRVIKNLKEGSSRATSGNCDGGAVATWSPPFWRAFDLKAEVYAAMMAKLRSGNDDEIDYVFRYCWPSMAMLYEKVPKPLDALAVQRLKAGDERWYNVVHLDAMFSEQPEWSPDVVAACQEFRQRELPVLDAEDDDMPF